ncbi:MAG: recombinase RecT [Kordiimonadaceae bacterium]|nr:recombinase RecT [Kordiimonadaceae bacterium]
MTNAVATTMNAKDPVQFQIAKMTGEFTKALPAHIPSEKFARTAITAIKNAPDLAQAFQQNPTSVFSSLMKAAQDGLVPDGREAALVVFNSKNRQTGEWLKTAQYMPMVAGIMKKVRNSGEIAALNEPQIVYKGDEFILKLGDNPTLTHNPNLFGTRGDPIGAYAVAKLTDGTVQRSFMSVEDINKRRAVSKASGKGPWVDWWDEMAKKTVLKQLCKYLPQSTDLDAAFEKDETMQPAINQQQPELTAIEGAPEVDEGPQHQTSKLDNFAAVDAEVIVAEADETTDPTAPIKDMWSNWRGGEPLKDAVLFTDLEKHQEAASSAGSLHSLTRTFATQEPTILQLTDKEQALLLGHYNACKKQFKVN